jgi:hypothetical protein
MLTLWFYGERFPWRFGLSLRALYFCLFKNRIMGGFGPLPVGESRRLVSRVAVWGVVPSFNPYLQPLQLGVGISGWVVMEHGQEAGIYWH